MIKVQNSEGQPQNEPPHVQPASNCSASRSQSSKASRMLEGFSCRMKVIFSPQSGSNQQNDDTKVDEAFLSLFGQIFFQIDL